MSERQWRPECVICKESVELEEGKVDEYRTGYSVEFCVSKLAGKKTAEQQNCIKL